jgi:hypothetical protein
MTRNLLVHIVYRKNVLQPSEVSMIKYLQYSYRILFYLLHGGSYRLQVSYKHCLYSNSQMFFQISHLMPSAIPEYVNSCLGQSAYIIAIHCSGMN